MALYHVAYFLHMKEINYSALKNKFIKLRGLALYESIWITDDEKKKICLKKVLRTLVSASQVLLVIKFELVTYIILKIQVLTDTFTNYCL